MNNKILDILEAYTEGDGMLVSLKGNKYLFYVHPDKVSELDKLHLAVMNCLPVDDHFEIILR